MQLWIEGGGFDTEDIESGIEAALDVLLMGGSVTPSQAYRVALEAADDKEGVDPAIVALWKEAEKVAIEAAADSWVEVPQGATLVWE